MTWETIRSIWEVYTGNRDSFPGFCQEDPRIKKIADSNNGGLNGYSQVAIVSHRDNTLPSKIEEKPEPHPHAGLQLPPDPDANPDDCQYICMYIEYWFLYQHHFKSAYVRLAPYYFTIFLVRWVIFAIFAIVWYKYPITMYIIFLVINVFMVWLTIDCRKSFRMFYFWWLLGEEILVLFWHLASLISFADYYGKGTMRQGGVDFLSHVQFWSYVATVSFEFIMIIVPLFYNKEYYSHFKGDLPKAYVPPAEHREPITDLADDDNELQRR
jgi:hypothetical protein